MKWNNKLTFIKLLLCLNSTTILFGRFFDSFEYLVRIFFHMQNNSTDLVMGYVVVDFGDFPNAAAVLVFSQQ